MDCYFETLQRRIDNYYDAENDLSDPLVSFTELLLFESIKSLKKRVEDLEMAINEKEINPYILDGPELDRCFQNRLERYSR